MRALLSTNKHLASTVHFASNKEYRNIELCLLFVARDEAHFVAVFRHQDCRVIRDLVFARSSEACIVVFSWILEYLSSLKDFTMLLEKIKYSSIASCLPMQFLSPSENPQTLTSFSKAPFLMKRSGMNFSGSGKFAGLCITAVSEAENNKKNDAEQEEKNLVQPLYFLLGRPVLRYLRLLGAAMCRRQDAIAYFPEARSG